MLQNSPPWETPAVIRVGDGGMGCVGASGKPAETLGRKARG